MLRRIPLGLAVLALTALALAQTAAYELPGDEVYPEGIAYDEAGGQIFVTSTSDGAILRINAETGEVDTFSPGGSDGRTAALGMTVDDAGRLWVAGSRTGRVFVYDVATGELIRAYDTPAAENTLLNDVITTANGDAYITDSFRPILFKVPAEGGELEPWLDLSGAIEHMEGPNLNGIEATPDGRYLITVQMNTGKLFRIDTQSQEITEIDLGGETLMRGDGLVLDGQTLYVIYNRNPDGINVGVVELSDDFASGTVTGRFTDPSIAASAATGALVNGELLVVNAQQDRRQEGNPELPFTVARVPVEMIRAGQTE